MSDKHGIIDADRLWVKAWNEEGISTMERNHCVVVASRAHAAYDALQADNARMREAMLLIDAEALQVMQDDTGSYPAYLSCGWVRRTIKEALT